MSQRHGMMSASNEKAKNLSKTLSTLLKYLKPFRIAIVFVIIFAVGSTIFTIIGPKILGNATTKLVQGLIAKYSGTGSIDIDGIKHTLLLLLCIYVLSGILSYIQAWIMSGVTQKVTYRLREEISLKINRLPLNYYDKQTHGEVLSRITNDVDTMSQSLTQSIQMIFTSLITIIGILYMMITISWQMTLMALVIVPLSAVAAMSVDFGFKLLSRGYHKVFLPSVELFHYESKSRGLDITKEKLIRYRREVKYMQEKWSVYLKHDPYYSNLFDKAYDYRLKLGVLKEDLDDSFEK